MKRRVTTNGVDGFPFAFSPDGTRLIYYRAGDLWVINLDGTGEKNITNTPDIIERQVDWVGEKLCIGKLANLKITPGSITISCGGNYDFEAQGYNQYGNVLDDSNLEYHWQISTNLGIISPTTGKYTILQASTIPTTGTLTVTVGIITTTAKITLATSTNYSMTGTIVFVKEEGGKNEICVMRADKISTYTKVNIVHDYNFLQPKLSKDGRFMTYNCGEFNYKRLYSHNLLTGTETLLQKDIRWINPCIWNIKSDKIYYWYSATNNREYGIYNILPDGKSNRLIEGTNIWGIGNPTINSEENLLAYAYNHEDKHELRLCNLANNKISNERILLVRDGVLSSLLFSPDGRRIAYIDAKDKESLWIISLDGKMRRKIVNYIGGPFAFSPDGTRIIFHRGNGISRDLYIINLDGTGEQNITNTASINEWDVDWIGEISPIFILDQPKSAPLLIKETLFPTDLNGVYVYPNPTDGKKLCFTNLTRYVRIRIYTIAGEEVLDKEVETKSPGEWEWNCRGSEGQRLASGIYIYLITNEWGQKKTGKLGIVTELPPGNKQKFHLTSC